MLTFERYNPSTRTACLGLFDANTPRFFAASERPDFERFLDHHASARHFEIGVLDGEVVSCGGFRVDAATGTAALAWGMVAPEFHGRGIGRVMTHSRLGAASRHPGVIRIILDTSQHTQGFYARLGFKPVSLTRDGYGPGLDRWDMVLAAGE
ncbi:GNAT family N-acetyltransferase [Pseudomonas sp. Marseille-QA0892]